MAKSKTVRGLNAEEASSFKIAKLIIHEIPTHAAGATGGGPNLSEYVSPIDNTLKSFFQDRLGKTMQRQAQPVEENTKSSSKVPAELRKLVKKSPKGFLKCTQTIAEYLYTVQNQTTSEGLLAIAIGTATVSSKTKHCVLIMKLEKSEGANIAHEKKNGKTALAPRHVRDLMLSDKTRVFKSAVICESHDQVLEGIVSDQQTESGAEMFRGSFLGFKLGRSPAVVTREFSESVDRWIGKHISDSETLLRYRTALRAELECNDKQLSPNGFITKFIDTKDRQSLEDALKIDGIPLAAFEKSKQLLKNKHLQTRSKTKKGITIYGDSDVMGNLVKPTAYSGEREHLFRPNVNTCFRTA